MYIGVLFVEFIEVGNQEVTADGVAGCDLKDDVAGLFRGGKLVFCFCDEAYRRFDVLVKDLTFFCEGDFFLCFSQRESDQAFFQAP